MGPPQTSSARAAQPTYDDPLVGSVLADTYRVEAILADGGMSRLYRATHLRLGLEVAIKVAHISRSHRPESAERAEREARALARLQCENVVSVLDLCVTPDQRPCVVTELLEGGDLEGYLKEVGTVDVDRAVGLALGICRGLEPAHAAGLVHRDLKPSNVFLTSVDGREVVKVLDFGVVKLEGAETLTHEGAFVGTPGYMAPEQAEAASDVDERADVYAVGAILYRMLTGQSPYGDLDAPQTLARLLTEAPPPVRARAPTLPDEVAAIVDGAMARRPADRIGSIRDLRRQLEALQPPSGAQGPQRFLRMRSVGAALLAGLAAGLWLVAAGAAFAAEVELPPDWSSPTPETMTVAGTALATLVSLLLLRRLFRVWRSPRGLWQETRRTYAWLSAAWIAFALLTLVATAAHWTTGSATPFVPYERSAILAVAALIFTPRWIGRGSGARQEQRRNP